MKRKLIIKIKIENIKAKSPRGRKKPTDLIRSVKRFDKSVGIVKEFKDGKRFIKKDNKSKIKVNIPSIIKNNPPFIYQ